MYKNRDAEKLHKKDQLHNNLFLNSESIIMQTFQASNKLLPFSKWLILGIFRKNHKKHKKNTKTQKHKNVIAYVTQDLSNNNLSSFILKKNFTFIFRVCLFSLQNVVT